MTLSQSHMRNENEVFAHGQLLLFFFVFNLLLALCLRLELQRAIASRSLLYVGTMYKHNMDLASYMENSQVLIAFAVARKIVRFVSIFKLKTF